MDPSRSPVGDDDLSALAWVQAELRRSLEAAHKALRRHLKEAEAAAGSDLGSVDPSVLRSARAQLHQGVGALELVGLPAAAQVLRASEAAVQRMVAKPAQVDAKAVETVEKLSFALLDFLSRQLAGKPVSPLSLFPQYRAAQQLAGAERVHPADLWPLDFRWQALPAEPGVQPRPADDSARAALEAGVLALMRTPDAATLARMSQLCAELAAGAAATADGGAAPAPVSPAATLWALAAAVFQAQSAGLLTADVYSKRLASRLLAQLRAAGAPSDRLAQDLLFFCAHAAAPDAAPHATHPAPRLAAVRQAWRLDEGVGAQAAADYDTPRLGRFDPALVALAKKRMAGAKDAWSAVAGGEMHRLVGLAEQFALVGDSVQRLFPGGSALSQALQTAAGQTADAGAEPPAALAMEVATALLYLDASVEDGEFDHPELDGRVQRLARRIDEVRGGAEPQPLEAWMEELYRRVSDRQTMGSVVQELRASLSEVEKQIDTYFRQPAQREVLIPVPAQLQAMRGVLSVLGMDQASQAVLHMRDDVDALAQTEVDPQRAIATGTFDRLADNLGALSFLIDMLSVQPQLAKSLFRFDPDSGSLSAVMGQSERVSAFAMLDESPADDAAEADAPAPGVPSDPDPFALALPDLSLPDLSLSDPSLPGAEAGPPPVPAPEQDLPLLAQSQALLRALQRPEVDDTALAQRLAQMAQRAVAEDQPALSRTLAEAGRALRAAAAAADAEARAAVRASLGQALDDALAPLLPPPPAPPAAPPQQTTTPAAGGTGLEDDLEMREIFVEEAREVVAEARAALERLADAPESPTEMTAVRRAFHTLKGSSRMLGLRDFGEAAWACEQLYNARLAQAPRMDGPLRALTGEALDHLAGWTEAIAAGRDDGHHSAPVSAAADALRLHGRREPIVAPLQPVPAETQTDMAAPAEAVPEPDLGLDLQPEPEAAAEPEPEPEPEPAAVPAVATVQDGAPPVVAPDFAFDLGTEAAAATAPDTAPAAPAWAQDATPAAVLDFDFDLGADEAAAPPAPAVEPAGQTAAIEPIEPLSNVKAIDAIDAIEAVAALDEIEAVQAVQAVEAIEPVEPALQAQTVDPAEEGDALDAPAAFEPIDPAAAVLPLPSLTDRVPDLPSAADLDLGDPFALDLGDLGEPAGAPAAAEPAPAAEPVEIAAPDLPAEVAEIDALTEAELAAFFPVAAPEPEPEPEPVAAIEPEPVAEPPAEPAAAAFGTPPAGFDDEPVKVIGPLRIGIPLFNIFLNEADEQSRRLGVALAEWSLEHERRPVPEDSIALAHSLAGNSATVGHADLSHLARALEHALMRSQARGAGRADEAALFVDVAEDIRRLLHQFAAGFLQPVAPGLMERLAEHEREPVPAQEPAAEPEPQAERQAEPEPVPVPEPEPEPEPADRVADSPYASVVFATAPLLPPVVLSDFTPLPERTLASGTRVRADAFDDDEDIDAVDAIDAELWPIFEEEASELLPQLQTRLRDWLQAPADAGPPAACMRTLHTLKGGARLAGAMRLGEMAHRLETAIEHRTARDGLQAADVEPLLARADAMSALFEALGAAPPAAVPADAPPAAVPADAPPAAVPADAPPAAVPSDAPAAAVPADVDADADAGLDLDLGMDLGMVATPPSPEPQADLPAPAPAEPPLVDAEARAATATAPALPRLAPPIDWSRFAAPASAAAVAAVPGPAAPADRGNAAVRVRAGLLDRLVNQAGEVAITRARIDAEMKQLQGALVELTDSLDRMRRQLRDIELQAETQMSSRLEAAKAASQAFDPLEMDRFTRFQELTRFMAESVNDVATLQRSLQRTLQSTEDELAAQARLTRELQDDLLRTRMVEFESLAERLYRVVRQAAKDAGKAVRLDIVGGAIEVDRGVLERMVGPFEHLLRNSVAHGIEAALQRQAAGKDPSGRIVVSVTQAGNEVAVEVADDGAGLDLPRIRQRALERGLLAPGAAPSDAELAALIFAPGFSTAESVTELAGRGVGMDVVRAEVNAMGGRIETATAPGHGTRFTLLLPLTTAVTQVVMLRAGDLAVAVPSTLVEIVRRLPGAEVDAAYARGAIDFGGEAVPFFWLPALLQGPARGDSSGRSQAVVVVRSAAQRVALHIDELTANQEVVVKNIGPQLARLPGLAGVTLLPSGAVALIYNPVALASLYGDEARARLHRAEVPADGTGTGLGGAPAAPRRAPLVMVVDDSLTVRRVTQRLLQREGYRVVTAKDGLDALEKLGQERPALLLSDIEMPRMDGFDLLRNVRADPAFAGLPVAMITSRTADKHREHATALGADHYLGKPYAEDELLGIVARHAGVVHTDIET